MISKLLIGWGLMAVCVVIHAAGISTAVRRWRRLGDTAHTYWGWTWLFILVAAWIILLHLAEISGWAVFYAWKGAMPDAQTAFYFSAVTYTTTGYGDLLLPAEWRVVGGIEALTGILMCGWSTGFFVATVSQMYQQKAPGPPHAVAGSDTSGA